MSIRDLFPLARPELSTVLGPADAAGRWPCPSPRHPAGSHEPSVLAGVAASTWRCVACGDGGRARDLALLLAAGDVGRARRLLAVSAPPQLVPSPPGVPLELVRAVPLDGGGGGEARPVGGPADVVDEVVVEGLGPTSSVGVLAALLGWPDAVGLAIDERWWTADAQLEATGIGRGSVVGPARPRSIGGAPPVAQLVGVAGPEAGCTEALPVGHRLVRRAALLAVAANGAVAVTALDPDVTVAPGSVTVGPHRAEVRPGAPAEEPSVVTTVGSTPWTRTANRPPRPAPPADPEPPLLPARPRAPGPVRTGVGLVPTLVSVVGAAVAALVLHQTLFLLLAGFGALATLVTAAQQRWVARRAQRAHRRDLAAANADRAQAVAAAHAQARVGARAAPELALAVQRAVARSARLWERRRHHPDVGLVSLGRGDVAWTWPGPAPAGEGDDDDLARLVATHAVLADVPVTLTLVPGTVVGIVGSRPAARALARSLLVQLVVHEGPADRRLAVVTDDADRPWRWVTWLPHAGGVSATDHAVAVGAAASDRLLEAVPSSLDGGPGLVLVVDGAGLAAARTSAARTVLAGRRGPVVALVLAEQADELPAACTHVVRLSPDGGGVVHTVTPAHRQPFHPAGASEATAARVARAMARFEDPERVDASALPATVALRDLLGPDAIDGARLAAAWAGLGPDPAPRSPIGVAIDGVVELDLERDGPHALVAGTTGAGKSELLRSWVVGLAVRCPPHDVTFLLLDYKGGAAFDACAELPHVVGVVTDLDDALAERALRSLEAEVRRREHLLRDAGATDLRAYRAGLAGAPAASAEPLPRLVVVVDEFATLAAELPGFVSALVGVAQRGRSLGVHLVLATQRPAGAITDDIRANTNLRVALRVQDTASSLDLVADPVAATFDRARPGRMALRLGPGELLVAQAAHCTGVPATGTPAVTVAARDAPRAAAAPTARDATALDLLVATVQDAHRRHGGVPPRRPWLDPLPTALALGDLPAGTIGWVDEPDRQRRVPLAGIGASGNLVVLGADAATLPVLETLVVDAVRSAPPVGRHVYVVATHERARWAAVGRLSAVGAVVAVHERDRLERLAVVLHDELRERRGQPDVARPELLLIVDGLAALRDALDDVGGGEAWASFEAVLADGGAAGIHAAVAVDRVGSLPGTLAPAVTRRWVVAGADGHDTVLWGVPHPGRAGASVAGRIVLVGVQLAAQVAAVSNADLAVLDCAVTDRPPAIDALPAHVDLCTLPPARRDGDAWLLPFGLADGRHHEPAVLRVHDGEHVLVAGPARAGKSTTLAVLLAQRRAADPEVAIVVVARRGPLAREPPAGVQLLDPDALASYHWPRRPLVVAVDDADSVDDVHGALAALLSRPDTLVLASGRPEALRAAYGSWSQLVRRSRLGVLLRPQPDLDGDLLGATLPRRRALAARPGHGYLVDDQGIQIVQVAATCRCA